MFASSSKRRIHTTTTTTTHHLNESGAVSYHQLPAHEDPHKIPTRTPPRRHDSSKLFRSHRSWMMFLLLVFLILAMTTTMMNNSYDATTTSIRGGLGTGTGTGTDLASALISSATVEGEQDEAVASNNETTDSSSSNLNTVPVVGQQEEEIIMEEEDDDEEVIIDTTVVEDTSSETFLDYESDNQMDVEVQYVDVDDDDDYTDNDTDDGYGDNNSISNNNDNMDEHTVDRQEVKGKDTNGTAEASNDDDDDDDDDGDTVNSDSESELESDTNPELDSRSSLHPNPPAWTSSSSYYAISLQNTIFSSSSSNKSYDDLVIQEEDQDKPSSSSSCIESHIHTIPGNVYIWCYKKKKDMQRTMGYSKYDSDENKNENENGVTRVISSPEEDEEDDNDNDNQMKQAAMMIKAINSHPHLDVSSSQDKKTMETNTTSILSNNHTQHDLHLTTTHDNNDDNNDDYCFANLNKLGVSNIKLKEKGHDSIVIGPCNYKYPQKAAPRDGYTEAFDFYFFRDTEQSKFTNQLVCLNTCIDRALTWSKGDNSDIVPNAHARDVVRGMDDIQDDEKVPVDNIMLIEAARSGLVLATEKLLLEYGLDPLYRQIEDRGGDSDNNSRSFNAIQEAIRGGYTEIVSILTGGDTSTIIDPYGRTVEDYVKMKGSPIRPIDAKNVLGIDIEEEDGEGESESESESGAGSHKRRRMEKELQQEQEQREDVQPTNSGWNETTAFPYDKELCDFDVIEGDLDPEVFHRDYFMTGRPVVLRRQASQEEIDMFSKERWSQTKLFHPTNNNFRVGPTAYPLLSDQKLCMDKMSLHEIEQGNVCKEMPDKPMVSALHPRKNQFKELYPIYDGNPLDKRGGFRAIQKYFSLVKDPVWQVFFGGDGSGATYHWHAAAFNILYVGVKVWKIGPPIYRGFSGMTPRKAAEILDDKVTLTCIQNPGDMIYIPNYWGHSTVNHGFTIGAAAIVTEHLQNGGTAFRGGVKPHDDKDEESNNEDDDNEDDDNEDDDNEDDDNEDEDEDDTRNPSLFLFAHINKTGGTSLISMFHDRCRKEYDGRRWVDSDGGHHRAFHATAHSYIERYGRETWDEAYTFAVVRHPLARQVSNFFFLARKCGNHGSKCNERQIPTLDLDLMSDKEKVKAFHEWILNLYKAFPPGSPEHYRFGTAGHGNEVYDTFSATQTSWLVDSDGNIVVKDVYKLEELSKDLSRLADKIPCLKNGDLNMVEKNKTSQYPSIGHFTKNERTIKIINEIFADDFDNFGYEKM